tara:strand:+ start:286 stop:462 length:177 start_codon:yes stop_codon:yes gene_type:complete
VAVMVAIMQMVLVLQEGLGVDHQALEQRVLEQVIRGTQEVALPLVVTIDQMVAVVLVL